VSLAEKSGDTIPFAKGFGAGDRAVDPMSPFERLNLERAQMARQDSRTDLAGRLGASLTPRVSTASSQRERNSGLFDMSALYTEAFDQVMRRARAEVHLAPLARAPRLPWPPPASPGLSDSRYLRPLAPELEMDVPVDFGDPFAVRRSRGRGLGWFGIAIAWLATVTIGAVLATTVPAHAFPRSSVRAAVALPAVLKPSTPDSTMVFAPAAAWTAVPVTQTHQVAIAAPAIAAVASAAPAIAAVASAAPAIAAVASAAPAIAAVASAAPAIAAVASVPITAAPAARPDLPSPAAPAPRRLPKAMETPASLASVATARPTPAPAPVSVAPVVAPAPVSVAPPSPRAAPEKPRVVAGPASSAGMSLEDLIRHEVQAESGKTHH
jgi:hypothetical protein